MMKYVKIGGNIDKIKYFLEMFMNKVKSLRSLTMKYKYSYKINEDSKYTLIIPKNLLKKISSFTKLQ